MIRVCSLAFALALSAPLASAAPASVAGQWTGKYVCGQGITSLELDVVEAKGGRLKATFHFGPLPENPDVPKGAYAMTGVFNSASRRIELRGDKWMKQPLGYFMVDLEGALAKSGDRLTGQIPFAGCSWFELIRGDQPIA